MQPNQNTKAGQTVSEFTYNADFLKDSPHFGKLSKIRGTNTEPFERTERNTPMTEEKIKKIEEVLNFPRGKRLPGSLQSPYTQDGLGISKSQM